MATAHTYLERVDTCFLDGSPWEQCPRVCADGVCILVFFIMIQIYGWWLRPVIYRPLPTLQARPILHVAAPGCEYARAGSAKSTGAMCWKVHALPPFVVEVVQSWLSNRARAESWRMREKWLFKKKKLIPVLVIALCKHFFYGPILFGWSVCNLSCALNTFTATENSTARKNVYFWESHCLAHLVKNTRVDERKERE